MVSVIEEGIQKDQISNVPGPPRILCPYTPELLDAVSHLPAFIMTVAGFHVIAICKVVTKDFVIDYFLYVGAARTLWMNITIINVLNMQKHTIIL